MQIYTPELPADRYANDLTAQSIMRISDELRNRTPSPTRTHLQHQRTAIFPRKILQHLPIINTPRPWQPMSVQNPVRIRKMGRYQPIPVLSQ